MKNRVLLVDPARGERLHTALATGDGEWETRLVDSGRDALDPDGGCGHGDLLDGALLPAYLSGGGA